MNSPETFLDAFGDDLEGMKSLINWIELGKKKFLVLVVFEHEIKDGGITFGIKSSIDGNIKLYEAGINEMILYARKGIIKNKLPVRLTKKFLKDEYRIVKL